MTTICAKFGAICLLSCEIKCSQIMKQFCARYTGMQFAVICVDSIQTFSNEFAGDHNNTHTQISMATLG